MAQTNVAAGSNLAIKQFSVVLSSQITRAPGNLKALTGAPPTSAQAQKNLKFQTAEGMPFVRIRDLATNPKGDKVSVDAFDAITMKPIMGDRNAEGRGQRLSSSSFEVTIDLATFNVDAGGKMSRQRTVHELRMLAKANLARQIPMFAWQRCLVHAAGMRGSQTGVSWNVPIATDADFAEIMVNTVKAPTYNRHYVLNGSGLTRGGLQAASLATTDLWKLARLDDLALICESMETKLPPPRVEGDEQAYDSPIKGILMMPPSSYNSLITDLTSGNNLRAFQSAVEQRQKWAPNSAVFRGDCGMWRGILVKKMDHTVKLAASASFNYVAVADRLTATETAGTVAAGLSTTHQLERSILLGAQSIARCEGASNSGEEASIIEVASNGGRNFEYLGEYMAGEAKFRFSFPNESGDKEPTDNVLVIDAAAPIVAA
mgnify:FL=1